MRYALRWLTVGLWVSVMGCSEDPPGFAPEPVDAAGVEDLGVVDDVGDLVDTGGSTDRGVIPIRDTGPAMSDNALVYAHSDDALYEINPRTNALRRIGTFAFERTSDRSNMTDLAVDAMGNVVAVTGTGLFRVDTTNARVTKITDLPDGQFFVGLTYLPAGTCAWNPSEEALIGATATGTYWSINSATGRATRRGTFADNWALSGDIVSVAGAQGGTFATVRRGTGADTIDSLARIDPCNGRVTIIGSTGFSRIFGLAYYRQTLYGFTRTGEFVTISQSTGRGVRVSMPAMQFSGAGVTTLAPTAPP